jgi:transposase-like protein
MSNTTKKESTKGIRYTDAQKKEVVDFAVSYNAANGRGGQSKAAEKFSISQLTIAGWLKASGAPSSKGNKAPKVAKVAKAAKAAKASKAPKAAKAAGGSKMGSRYTAEEKQEVIDFVVSYNEANGRGGPSKASQKFSISPLTVVAWLKAAGVTVSKNASKKSGKYVAPSKVGRVAKVARTATTAVSGGINAKLSNLLSLSNQIDSAEAELVQLRAKFSALKASL